MWFVSFSFNGLCGRLARWMDGISRSVAASSSSSSLACVCVGCVNGPGLWLSSECATLTSGYSMRMAGWPIRIDNRLVGRGEVVMILLALASGDGGWNRCSASANGWNGLWLNICA